MGNPNDSSEAATTRGPQIGQTVGHRRYELKKVLGQGGMGVVWLAQDKELGEPVALKFLPDQIRTDATALDDLRQETLKSRKLTHPHIVRIHDLFQAPDEGPFISMEYVDGSTLSAMRVQDPQKIMKWDFLSSLVKQLCEALEYAHGEKVVHRDLKPANLMLDSRTRIKLADFGIARVVTDSMSRISMRQGTSGTLVYMSPQQLNGEASQITDDIYSLGSTLYELLTGKPPFYTGEIAHQIRYVEAAPIPARLKEFQRVNDVPPHVQETIIACLAKNPTLRPQTAREVAVALGIMETKPPTARPATKKTSKRKVVEEDEGDIEEVSTSRRGLVVAAMVAAVAAAGYYGRDHLPMLTKAKGKQTQSELAATNLAVAPAPTFAPVTPEVIAAPVVSNIFQPVAATNVSAPPPAATVPPPVTSVAITLPPPPADLSSKIEVRPLVSPNANPTSQPPAPKYPRAGRPWSNSLGMSFVPVPGTTVLFGAHEARVKDYELYARSQGALAGTQWADKTYALTPNHAVVFVSWEDAKAFCEWLTRQEQATGSLTADQYYRLPMDAEWSLAAEVRAEEGKTPMEKHIKGKAAYLWGGIWPPPKNSANLADQDISKAFYQRLPSIPGYQDPYPSVAPVGSFAANTFGIHDLSGNVWEWCEDSYDTRGDNRPLRGGAWDTEDSKEASLTARHNLGTKVRMHNAGFRCVLAVSR